jgi:hypothetical protein
MKMLRETFQSTPVNAGALGVLVLGLAVHTFLNAPRIDEVAGLQGRHANLMGQIGQLARQERENRELERLYTASRGGGIEADGVADPLAFIGREVDICHLNRIELGTDASGTAGNLQVTRFTLRVSGAYPRIVEFIRRLEQGPRTVAIQSVAIEPMLESGVLEARMHLAVYDPIARR